jgi:hypothetical protein
LDSAIGTRHPTALRRCPRATGGRQQLRTEGHQLLLLIEQDVEFVLVGGLAAVAHGSAYVTISALEALLELRKPA